MDTGTGQGTVDSGQQTADSGQHVQMRMRNYWNKLITADCAWRCHGSTANPNSFYNFQLQLQFQFERGRFCWLGPIRRELIYARPHSKLVGGILLWCSQDTKSLQLQLDSVIKVWNDLLLSDGRIQIAWCLSIPIARSLLRLHLLP